MINKFHPFVDNPVHIYHNDPVTNKKIFPFILSLSIITTLILAGYLGYRYFLGKATPASINLVGNTPNDPYVALTLEPGFLIKSANSVSEIGLTIDTGEQKKVKTIRVEISYSPDQCLPPVVTKGDFFSRVISPPQVDNGLIRFAYGVNAGSSAKQGNGTIATIKTGPTTGNCTLTITQNTRLTDHNNTSYLPTTITPATLKLQTPNPSGIPAFKQPQYHPDTLSR